MVPASSQDLRAKFADCILPSPPAPIVYGVTGDSGSVRAHSIGVCAVTVPPALFVEGCSGPSTN